MNPGVAGVLEGGCRDKDIDYEDDEGADHGRPKAANVRSPNEEHRSHEYNHGEMKAENIYVAQ